VFWKRDTNLLVIQAEAIIDIYAICSPSMWKCVRPAIPFMILYVKSYPIDEKAECLEAMSIFESVTRSIFEVLLVRSHILSNEIVKRSRCCITKLSLE